MDLFNLFFIQCHDNPREFFPQNKGSKKKRNEIILENLQYMNVFFVIYLDEAIRLHRDVVLVTDDRNLRLKAQARNVPVKDLNKFLQLAQITI